MEGTLKSFSVLRRTKLHISREGRLVANRASLSLAQCRARRLALPNHRVEVIFRFLLR